MNQRLKTLEDKTQISSYMLQLISSQHAQHKQLVTLQNHLLDVIVAVVMLQGTIMSLYSSLVTLYQTPSYALLGLCLHLVRI